jgi:hypothetical protein
VYNALGQEVAVLLDDLVEAGRQRVSFDAQGLSSGVYFYRLHARPSDTTEREGFVSIRRMMLVR